MDDYIDIILPETQNPYTIPGVKYADKDVMVIIVYPAIYLRLTREQYNDYLAKKYNIVVPRNELYFNINMFGYEVPIHIKNACSVW
jgi:hypothetical protein